MEKKKKEFAIGEVFQMGLIKMMCIEDKEVADGKPCKGCIFQKIPTCADLMVATGSCQRVGRSDKKDVIFVEVKDDED